MSTRVVVIIRQLNKETKAVICDVKIIPDYVDSEESYAVSEVIRTKGEIIKNYPEFETALFWYEIRTI